MEYLENVLRLLPAWLGGFVVVVIAVMFITIALTLLRLPLLFGAGVAIRLGRTWRGLVYRLRGYRRLPTPKRKPPVKPLVDNVEGPWEVRGHRVIRRPTPDERHMAA
jgi:hypothetical protein